MADQTWRIDVSCYDLGLPPPPCDLQIRRGDVLHMETMPGRLSAAAEWLRRHFDADVDDDGRLGGTDAVVRIRDPPFPFDAVLVARFAADGAATLVAAGDAGQHLGALLGGSRVRAAASGETTLRQRQVIQMAVALGYYDVPRRIDLRGLAARLGMAHSSLSELLRRAEASVVTQFCDQMLLPAPLQHA